MNRSTSICLILILGLLAYLPAQAQIQISGRPQLKGISATDNLRHSIAVGDSGLILSSTDRGKTWQPELSPTRFPLRSTSYGLFVNTFTRFIGGDTGTVLVSNGRNGTSNPLPWQKVRLNTRQHINYIEGGMSWWGCEFVAVTDSGQMIYNRLGGQGNILTQEVNLKYVLPNTRRKVTTIVRNNIGSEASGLTSLRVILGADSGLIYHLYRQDNSPTKVPNATFLLDEVNLDSISVSPIVSIQTIGNNNHEIYFRDGQVVTVNGLLLGTARVTRKINLNNLVCGPIGGVQSVARAKASGGGNEFQFAVLTTSGKLIGRTFVNNRYVNTCANIGTSMPLYSIVGSDLSGTKVGFLAVGDSGTVATSIDSLIVPARIVATGATQICKIIGAVTLSDSAQVGTGPTGYGYQWYRNGVALAGRTSSTLTVSDSGTYFVQRRTFEFLQAYSNDTPLRYYYADTNSNKVSVTFLPAPTTPTITAFRSDSLRASSDGIRYLWLRGNSPLTNDTTNVLRPGLTGQYRVIAYSANGCVSDTSARFDYLDCSVLPTAFRTRNDTTLCQGTNTILRYVAPAGITGIQYQWTKNGTNIPTGGTSNQLTVNDSATYRLIITRGNCQILSDTFKVMISPLPTAPTISPIGSINLCTGDSVVLSGPAGFANYIWTQGAANTVVGNNRTIVYRAGQSNIRLRVANQFGCQSPLSTSITTILTTRPNLPTLTQNGNNIVANVAPVIPGLNYRWLADGVALSTPTGATLTNASLGVVYRVIAFTQVGSCQSDTSAPLAIVSIEDRQNQNEIRLVPNPTTGNLILLGLTEGGQITIFGLEGRVVMIKNVDVNTTLNISDLPNGLYLYEVQTRGLRIKSGRLVKQ